MALQVVLLGPPGCGKGTQGHLLADAAGAAYFSTGKQLRRELESGTALGEEARPFLDAGRYVPDAMALRLALDWLQGVEGGWVLDGFPRTLAQARELDRHLGPAAAALQAVLLEVPTGELESRVGVRRECVQCAWVGTRSEAAEASG
ncbi:MAG: nucleoside monophosphate kinase, partial [Akkermansiaceae bacterium]|nr:nucleoside monophosphate kinase [Akkermansiaceae bacterium]